MLTKEDINNMINSVKVGVTPLNEGDNLVDSGILDSLSIMTFVSELSKKHGIQISADDNIRDIFSSVESIYSFVKNKDHN